MLGVRVADAGWTGDGRRGGVRKVTANAREWPRMGVSTVRDAKVAGECGSTGVWECVGVWVRVAGGGWECVAGVSYG